MSGRLSIEEVKAVAIADYPADANGCFSS